MGEDASILPRKTPARLTFQGAPSPAARGQHSRVQIPRRPFASSVRSAAAAHPRAPSAAPPRGPGHLRRARPRPAPRRLGALARSFSGLHAAARQPIAARRSPAGPSRARRCARPQSLGGAPRRGAAGAARGPGELSRRRSRWAAGAQWACACRATGRGAGSPGGGRAGEVPGGVRRRRRRCGGLPRPLRAGLPWSGPRRPARSANAQCGAYRLPESRWGRRGKPRGEQARVLGPPRERGGVCAGAGGLGFPALLRVVGGEGESAIARPGTRGGCGWGACGGWLVGRKGPKLGSSWASESGPRVSTES